MVRTYGNHPSFCLMTLGNEHSGVGDTLDYWVEMLHPRRPAALLLLGLGGPDDGQPAVHRGRAARHSRARDRRRFPRRRGPQGPAADGPRNRPVDVLPQFRRDPQIYGRARGQELRAGPRRPGRRSTCWTWRRSSSRPPADRPCCSTRKRSRCCSARPDYPGFSLLDLHDYPGPGHGADRPAGSVLGLEGLRHAEAAPPLLRPDRAAGAAEEADLHRRRDPDGRGRDRPLWPQGPCRRPAGVDHQDEQGHVVAAGSCRLCDIPTGKLTPLGQIRAPLAKAAAPCKLTVSLSLARTPHRERMGHLGLSGRKVDSCRAEGLVVSKRWNEA